MVYTGDILVTIDCIESSCDTSFSRQRGNSSADSNFDEGTDIICSRPFESRYTLCDRVIFTYTTRN